ncbi:MAG: hypothetical protein AAGK32_06880, partial [Actinomycetota bacterium]
VQPSRGLGELDVVDGLDQLGAHLARMSLRLLFTELIETIDDVELAEPPRRLHSNLINGIKEMQIGYSLR